MNKMRLMKLALAGVISISIFFALPAIYVQANDTDNETLVQADTLSETAPVVEPNGSENEPSNTVEDQTYETSPSAEEILSPTPTPSEISEEVPIITADDQANETSPSLEEITSPTPTPSEISEEISIDETTQSTEVTEQTLIPTRTN